MMTLGYQLSYLLNDIEAGFRVDRKQMKVISKRGEQQLKQTRARELQSLFSTLNQARQGQPCEGGSYGTWGGWCALLSLTFHPSSSQSRRCCFLSRRWQLSPSCCGSRIISREEPWSPFLCRRGVKNAEVKIWHLNFRSKSVQMIFGVQ